MKQLFDRQLALERRQGYRGPATRLVGPVASVAEANLVMRECSLALIGLGAIQVFLTMRLGWGSILVGVLIVAVSTALRIWPGLLTATTVVVVCLGTMVLQGVLLTLGYLAPLFLPSVRVLFAARAFWAAWRRRQLASERPAEGHMSRA